MESVHVSAMPASTSLAEALAARAASPRAVPVLGGTDLMVELNFRRREVDGLLDLGRIPELRRWSIDGATLRIGAGVTFTRLMRPPFDSLAPALAEAARTVGSPQIRNRATIGGNLATASPAGDSLPPLVAGEAEVELASTRGTRRMPVCEFLIGPKRSLLAADELVTAVHLPVARGAQTFMKIGPRNAMVISVASLALVVDEERGEVRAAFGSAGPVVGLVRASLTAAATLPTLVAESCTPIDDVRGSAAYRRHALHVLASRGLERCLP